MLNPVKSCPWVLITVAMVSSWAFAGEKPKYGPSVSTLSQSHEYFRQHSAPDFWALIPYYTAQQNGRSCSVASVAMIVNGARSQLKLGSEDQLVTQSELLKRAKLEVWTKNVGPMGRGMTLDQLGEAVVASLKAYGVQDLKVDVIHADDPQKFSAEKLRKILSDNEKGERNFLIVNFDQGVFTGDQTAGHIAPVGAFDSEKKKVLILDPDREWYEPYWVTEDILATAMSTHDNVSGRSRGLVWIH